MPSPYPWLTQNWAKPNFLLQYEYIIKQVGDKKKLRNSSVNGYMMYCLDLPSNFQN